MGAWSDLFKRSVTPVQWVAAAMEVARGGTARQTTQNHIIVKVSEIERQAKAATGIEDVLDAKGEHAIIESCRADGVKAMFFGGGSDRGLELSIS